MRRITRKNKHCAPMAKTYKSRFRKFRNKNPDDPMSEEYKQIVAAKVNKAEREVVDHTAHVAACVCNLYFRLHMLVVSHVLREALIDELAVRYASEHSKFMEVIEDENGKKTTHKSASTSEELSFVDLATRWQMDVHHDDTAAKVLRLVDLGFARKVALPKRLKET